MWIIIKSVRDELLLNFDYKWLRKNNEVMHYKIMDYLCTLIFFWKWIMKI